MGYLTREMGVKRRGCLYNQNFFDKTQNEESDDDLAEPEYVPKEPKRRKLKSRQKKSSVFVSSSSSGTSSDELPINKYEFCLIDVDKTYLAMVTRTILRLYRFLTINFSLRSIMSLTLRIQLNLKLILKLYLEISHQTLHLLCP